MSAWRTLLHRLGYLPRQRRFDRQLEAELQFHIESRADELEQEGYARADAGVLRQRLAGAPSRGGGAVGRRPSLRPLTVNAPLA